MTSRAKHRVAIGLAIVLGLALGYLKANYVGSIWLNTYRSWKAGRL